jgi:hypothetical protein
MGNVVHSIAQAPIATFVVRRQWPLTIEVHFSETLVVRFQPLQLKTMTTLVVANYLLGACSVLFSAESVDAGPQEFVDAEVAGTFCLNGTCLASARLSDGDQDVSVTAGRASPLIVFNAPTLGLGNVDGNSSTLEIAGFRFENLDVPKGASILDAEIQFTAAEAANATATINLTLENSALAAPFTTGEELVNRTPIMNVPATWNMQSPFGDWILGDRQLPQLTTSFIGAMLHLVNLPEWDRENNAIVVLVTGSLGNRYVQAFESDPAAAATLFVRYSE